jgi:hypothetical protein
MAPCLSVTKGAAFLNWIIYLQLSQVGAFQNIHIHENFTLIRNIVVIYKLLNCFENAFYYCSALSDPFGNMKYAPKNSKKSYGLKKNSKRLFLGYSGISVVMPTLQQAIVG